MNYYYILAIIPLIIFIKEILKNDKKTNNQEKESTEKQRLFEQLSLDHKWNVVKSFLDIINSSISSKMEVLPSLSAISAAVVVIFSSNKELVPISLFQLKIITSIFLFFIPICLILFINDLEKGKQKALKYYEEYTGTNLEDEINSTIYDRVVGNFPMFVAVIYLCVTLFILGIIWG